MEDIIKIVLIVAIGFGIYKYMHREGKKPSFNFKAPHSLNESPHAFGSQPA